MKTLLCLTALLLTLACSGQGVRPGLLAASRRVASAGADVTENFEATGYDVTWTEAVGNPAEDTATTGLSLEGSQCVYLTTESAAAEAYTSFTASDNVYVFFQFRFNNLNTGGARTQFYIADSSGNQLATVAMNNGPTQPRIYDGGETSFDDGSDTFAADTTYYAWLEYTKGTGANATQRFYTSTTTTKPGITDCQITNSNDTTQGARFGIGGSLTLAGDYYVDKVRVSRTTPFGSNPD